TYWPQAAGLFVPLVQLSLAHLRRDGSDFLNPLDDLLNRRTGDVLKWTPPEGEENRSYHMLTPDGERVLLGAPRGQGQPIEFSRTTRAGLYALQRTDARDAVPNLNPGAGQRTTGTLFAVNPNLYGTEKP